MKAIIATLMIAAGIFLGGCTHFQHRTTSQDSPYDSTKSDQDPNYDVSLDFGYQDFISYLYPGNRIENFTAYFNTFYKSKEDFESAVEEYRLSLISFYNRRLDSLGVVPVLNASVKEKFDKAIERSSKIIQFHKNSKFIDDAVLIIGKSYFYETDYYKSERTFNEFLSKFAASELADEAILFLGRSKIRLGKTEEGIGIFKDLVQKATDGEVRSQAARDLGILAYNKGNYDEAANYFKASIDFSKNNERKAEEQFILAKILSEYKPSVAAKEYRKVLDFTSDFDLVFYSRLNYGKGLIANKEYLKAAEELEDIRKKYRDEIGFTQHVDLEIANNLYAQKKYPEALEKYYEVIVKYPNSPVSSDAYYSLAKHEEDVNKNYLDAFVNYKKATEENASSDYYKESSEKAGTFERYFTLLDVISEDTVRREIPTVNANVERYRREFNEEKGIETIDQNVTEPPRGPDSETGDGKGRPGGNRMSVLKDTIEEQKELPDAGPSIEEMEKMLEEKQVTSEKGDTLQDSLRMSEISDSLKAVQDSIDAKTRQTKVFNAYYELAELFIYNLHQQDSAEHYLKILLTKFPESDNQAKILYTLGNFYKNNARNEEADATFRKIVDDYPNTVYAIESGKILGLTKGNVMVTQSPTEQFFREALDMFSMNRDTQAVVLLRDLVQKYPDDSLSAKALYGLGWIYENKIINKDSSVFYYKMLKEKFPESEYTVRVTPKLDYIASLEPKDSTGTVANDTTNVEGVSPVEEGQISDTTKTEVKPDESGEVKIEQPPAEEEGKLSQEEIDKLLKETESPTTEDPPKP